ncbi:MAG: hypothetical protein OEV40_25575, partial [Acidimicrobiia bacterium]|nr:hypothetical protein [Acidimicrobiia bacterium]
MTAPCAAHAQLVKGETVQGALRHHHPLLLQQLMDLHHRQPRVLQPDPELIAMAVQHPPRLPTAIGPIRTDPLNDQTQEHIPQLVRFAVTDKAELFYSLR